MIRTGLIAGFAVLLCAGLTQAQGPGGAFPDIGAQYFQRANCHQAYDLVVEEVSAGGGFAEDVEWATSYEDAGNAGQPCPEPDAALASRATNRTVSTGDGLARLTQFNAQDDPAAWFESALAVLEGKAPEVEPAVGWGMLVKASELGYPHAKFYQAALYISGTATGEPDYATALPLLEEAAASGHVDALFLSGNYYYDGSVGVKKDKKKSFNYFSQAAERGHVYAAYMAAYMANDGDGVKTDHELAYRLARNLAAQGEVVGAVIAASALMQMDDARKHEDEVLYWLDIGIRDGDEKIRSQLSEMRPQVVAAYQRANAPPEYTPRAWKACPMKTVCLTDRFSGAQISCTTNKDYWNDCDG
jgi:TPR repeat protein